MASKSSNEPIYDVPVISRETDNALSSALMPTSSLAASRSSARLEEAIYSTDAPLIWNQDKEDDSVFLSDYQTPAPVLSTFQCERPRAVPRSLETEEEQQRHSSISRYDYLREEAAQSSDSPSSAAESPVLRHREPTKSHSPSLASKPPVLRRQRHSARPRLESVPSENADAAAGESGSQKSSPQVTLRNNTNRKRYIRRSETGSTTSDCDASLSDLYEAKQALLQSSAKTTSFKAVESNDDYLNQIFLPPPAFRDPPTDDERRRVSNPYCPSPTTADVYDILIDDVTPTPSLTSTSERHQSPTSPNFRHGVSTVTFSISNSCPSALPPELVMRDSASQRPCPRSASPQTLTSPHWDREEKKRLSSAARNQWLQSDDYGSVDAMNFACGELTPEEKRMSARLSCLRYSRSDNFGSARQRGEFLKRGNASLSRAEAKSESDHSDMVDRTFCLDEKDDLNIFNVRHHQLNPTSRSLEPSERGSDADSDSSASCVPGKPIVPNPLLHRLHVQELAPCDRDSGEYVEINYPDLPPRKNHQYEKKPSPKKFGFLFGRRTSNDKQKNEMKQMHSSLPRASEPAIMPYNRQASQETKRRRRLFPNIFKRSASTTNLMDTTLESEEPQHRSQRPGSSSDDRISDSAEKEAEKRVSFVVSGDEPVLDSFKVAVNCFGGASYLRLAKDDWVDIVRVEEDGERLLGRNKDGQYGYVFATSLVRCCPADLINRNPPKEDSSVDQQ